MKTGIFSGRKSKTKRDIVTGPTGVNCYAKGNKRPVDYTWATGIFVHIFPSRSREMLLERELPVKTQIDKELFIKVFSLRP